jgi:2-polyprenyl-3-methyl-5-hydroxy-6-metoxy-1,4-benzoquinol methylase
MAGPIAPGARVLDIGCGGGYLAAKFAHLGAAVVGVDPNVKRIAQARSRYPEIRFEPRGAEPDLLEQLGEAPFDIVVSTEVLEHLYTPQHLATGAFAALKPNGRFVLSTPYHGYLKNLLIALTGKSDDHHQPLYVGGHIKFFSRSTVFRLLNEAGFEQLAFQGSGRLPGLWKSMVVSGVRPRA